MPHVARGLRSRLRHGLGPALVAVATLGSPAVGQVGTLTPVAIDDSPVAERLLGEIAAQTADNPERTAALVAELLDGYADRVVPVLDEPEMHRSVRETVLGVLAADAAVRAAWQDRHGDEALRLLDARREVEAWRRRPMTAGGLEAGLRLAQRDIELGVPEVGLRMLDEVGGWPGAEAGAVVDRIDLLRALAWVALAETDPEGIAERDRAVDRVRRRDPETADRLVSIAEGRAAAATSDATPLDEDSWTVLWEIPLEESLFRRRTVDVATGRSIHSNPDRVVRSGSYLTTLPTVAGDLVIINEGRLLEGIDRYTGRLQWFRDHGVGRLDRLSGIPADMGQVVVHDGDAYTVLGHASAGGRGGDRGIVRFDPATGVERWMVRPDRLDEFPLLDESNPSGPPLVVGDVVVVPLRKTTGRLETIDLVLALDRADGAVRWIRTIASSGSMRVTDPRPVAALATMDGDVLVAAAAGAVARLEARTGEIRWLRKEEVPLRGVSRISLPWQIAAPVPMDVGVATLDAARRHWLLLDSETGALLGRHPIGPGTVAGDARWLACATGALPDGGDLLLAIGDDVRAIDPRNPDVVVWSLRTQTAAQDVPFGTVDDGGVRGRVQVTDRGLLVPLVDGLLAVDPRNGRARTLIAFDGPVNPVLAGDAILAAGSDSIATAMPVREAVATLERRIRESPDAVAQAIALMELAERIGRADLLRLAATAAVEGLERPGGETWRGEVLDLLLDAVPAASDDDGRELLALAARAADDVRGRVRHRLARAAWLEARGRREEAAREWVGVIGDGEAASVMVRMTDDHEVSAGAIARGRLSSVLSGDDALSRRLEVEAGEAVATAIAARATAPTLVELARRWAGSEAALTAASRAIEIHRDEDDPLSVAAVARVVARGFDRDDPRRRDLLLEAAAACEDIGRRDLARSLRRVDRDELESTSRPRLAGIPNHIEPLPGRLPAVSPTVGHEPPTDLILLFEPATLELVARDAATFEERWRRTIDAEHRVVGWTPDLLIWEGEERREPILTAIDPATGEVRWSTPQPSTLLPLPDRLAVNADGFLADGSVFLPYQVVPVPLEDGVVLVRRDGAVSHIDRTDGRTVSWSRREVMDRVYGATEAGGLLHLHGSGLDEFGESEGRLVSLDPATGRIVLSASIPSGEIRWLVADDLGRIAVGTATEIRLFDAAGTRLGGQDRWARRDGLLGDGVLGWIAGEDLVVVDEDSGIMAWDLSSGRTVPERWRIPDIVSEPVGRPLGTLTLGDRRVLHFDTRLFVHDRDGALVGADGMRIPGRRDWRLLPIDGRLMLITRVSNAATGAVHRIQLLDPDAGLRLVGRPFEIAGRPRYLEARAVEGVLLLSTEIETHAIPMRGDSGETPDSSPGP